MISTLEYREAALAPATRRNYREMFLAWERFALGKDPAWIPLPAEPQQLAAYLDHRAKNGDQVSTLVVRRAAIAAYHTMNGLSNPTTSADFRSFMQGLSRDYGNPPSQATGLTSDDLTHIRRIIETDDDRQDLALVLTMRDAMLRRSEAAALWWRDVEEQPDRSGRLMIRRSKTDQSARGELFYLAEPTMEALDAIRPNPDVGHIFRARGNFHMCSRTISNRIGHLCRRAGLTGQYSGHSPRIGMAQDLANGGATLVELMQAGRWRSPNMPALYIRKQAAERSAVAKFYRRKKA